MADTETVRSFTVTACGLLGLIVGSFMNVVVYRLPRGQSVVTPASRCPSCGTTLAWYDNVPVVSWVVLRARCRTCRSRISARYPAVELVTGAAFSLVAATAHPTGAVAPLLVLTTAAVATVSIDLDDHSVPRAVIAGAGAGALSLVLVSAALGQFARIGWGALGAVGLAAAGLPLARRNAGKVPAPAVSADGTASAVRAPADREPIDRDRQDRCPRADHVASRWAAIASTLGWAAAWLWAPAAALICGWLALRIVLNVVRRRDAVPASRAGRASVWVGTGMMLFGAVASGM